MKIIELIEDRRGRLSHYKLCFLLAAFVFLAGWGWCCYSSKQMVAIPKECSAFLLVLGSAQLGRTWMQNNLEIKRPATPRAEATD